MCTMNLHVHIMCIYIFMFSLFFFGLENYYFFCLSPVLRFNKVDWFYSQSLPVRGLCTVYNCVIVRSPYWVEDWYMYVYMYFWDIRRCHVTVRFYNVRDKLIGYDTLNFYSCISSVWKWHYLFLYSIYVIEGKQCQ